MAHEFTSHFNHSKYNYKLYAKIVNYFKVILNKLKVLLLHGLLHVIHKT